MNGTFPVLQGNVIGQPYYVRYFKDALGNLQVKYRVTAALTQATDGTYWQLGNGTSTSLSVSRDAASEDLCCMTVQHSTQTSSYSLQLEKSADPTNGLLKMTEQGVLVGAACELPSPPPRIHTRAHVRSLTMYMTSNGLRLRQWLHPCLVLLDML